jgi:hypothetical protein
MVPLSFGWRHPLFANWPVHSDVVAARVPDALDVEAYDGSAWLSVVPVLSVDTRPRGLQVMPEFPLSEVHLRTYVARDGEPGVYFFSLDADGLLSVLGARLAHSLPYYYASVRLRQSDGRIRVRSRRRHRGARPARFAASYEPTGEPYTADSGSLAEFLVERRRLYTEAPNGTLRYTDVAHDPWSLRDVDVDITENSLFEASGFEHPEAEPFHVYSPGVDVVTSRSKRY